MTDASKPSKKNITREKVVRRSAADFFQDNKAIAGFDNSMRVVFTSVRELVENGLDAAERMGHLPELHVTIKKLQKEEIAKLLNISSFESSEKLDFLRLTVKDNGSGIQSEFVPPLFGRVLTGSNYGARQSRGRFGLGAKMVLLNAMSSVDLPLIIKSKYINEDFTSYHELMINLAENEPIILAQREIPQDTAEAIVESGTEVSVTFTGAWNLASRYIYDYFSQLAMITPYASLFIQYPDSDSPIELERVVEEMPSYPRIAKVHPWGTDITQFKRELSVTSSDTMEIFLQEHFQGIGPKTARDFLDFVNIDHQTDPKKLSATAIRRIVHEGFTVPERDKTKKKEKKYFPFKRPSGDSLSPLGWELLEKGISKELSPQFVKATSGEISAYSGHPFIVEAALAYGGPNLSKEDGSRGANPKIYRFANRIPLLFGAGNDMISKCVQKMNWKNYKININKAPIAIVVSVVSSKIPFPETSKEYIADVDELRNQVNRVLKKLARGLGQHLGRAERERRERQRQSRFESAAPRVIQNLSHILTVENSPYLLTSGEEISKLQKALASAIPRLVRRSYPPSPQISTIGEWLPMDIHLKLVENNIQTIYQFLRTPAVELNSITGMTVERIDAIIRKTVTKQEQTHRSPIVRDFEFFSKEIERDFSKYRGSNTIHKSLNKRWIVNAFDFFSTPSSQLREVDDFPEKLIYETKLNTITDFLNSSSEDAFNLELFPWLTGDIEKVLKSAKITNILEFFVAFPEKISSMPKLAIRLIESAKEEIREGVKGEYIDPEKVIGASTFDWMDYRVTPKLRGRKISKIKDFLNSPSEKLADLNELIDNLIFKSKHNLKEALQSYNDKTSLFKIPGISNSMLSDLERLEVHGFIDFLLTTEKDLLIVRGLIDALILIKQDEILDEINATFDPVPIKQAYWLDLELEKTLLNKGISTIYDFISHPTEELRAIKGMDSMVLETIKRTYGTPITLIDNATVGKLESLDILCLEELISVISQEKIKPKSLSDKLVGILDQLNVPICYLPIPSKYFALLHHLGISKVINFLIWPDYDLHRKSGISYKIIEDIKSKITFEGIQKQISLKKRPISVLKNNLEQNSWTKLLNSDISVQELYYNLPYENEIIKNLKLTQKETNKLIELFNTPITRLSHIRPRWVNSLRSGGIKSFIDFLTWSPDEIAGILGRDREYVLELTRNIPKFTDGMDLIDLGVLTAGEMKTLKSRGYSTVESIYFCADKQTFGVMGVKWKKIERYQRILETPIAMIQLQASTDKSQIRVSHDGLESLANNGIDQIIKLIYWPQNELKSILNISLKRIDELKQAVAIKEHGMPLEHVAGYNRKTISTLTNYGIETVEDLYFSANEDMLDEEDDLDFTYVKKSVESLDLPVTYLNGIIPSKYIEKLVNYRLDTILRFLISSPNELANVLDTPPENVENLRQKVNLLRLRESTETSASIIEGLTRKQNRALAEENIISIYDFLTTSDEQLTNTIEIEPELLKTMKQKLNFTNIKTIKEEKMIPLTKISLFDKNTVRKFSRYGIESLADLYYTATPKTIEESDLEWQTILDARLILEMPIETSTIITTSEIKTFHQKNVFTIFDLMIDPWEELNKKTGIEGDRIKKIQESIRINEAISLLKNLSIERINFPPDYLKKINEQNLKTVYELLISTDENLFLKKQKEKKIRVTTELWTELFTIIATPLYLILGADKEAVKKLKQKKIDSIRDVYSTDPEKLTNILEQSPELLYSELKTLNFNELSQLLSIPISFIPSLPIDWFLPLRDNSILRVGDFIKLSHRDLATLVSASFPKIRSVSNEITFSSLMKKLEEEAIHLTKLSEYLPPQTIEKLSAKDITSLQSLILFSADVVKLDGIAEFLHILDGPINRLSEDFQVADLRKISNSGITTLGSWFSAPNDGLSTIVKMNNHEINKFKQRFNFKLAGKAVDTEITVSSVIESGFIDFDELASFKVNTLEDLLFIEIETVNASDQFKSRLNNLRDALNSSLAYYSLVPSAYVVPLAFNGITSVYNLIQTEFSQLEDPTGIISEETYEFARNSVNLVDILTHKKTESEFRVKLSSLRAFTPNQLTKIQELGIDNVIDLYFRLDSDRCPKSLIPAIDGVKRVLEKPVAVLPLVKETFPEKIPLLFNVGLTSIIEFLFWNKDELAEILEVKRYEISKYRKVNLSELKRKKNLGTPIQNFVRVSEQYHEPLHEFGITNIEDLYFYGKRYADLIPDELVPKKLLKACISDLEMPVVKLAELPIPSAQELVKNGVTRIIDFIYWPEESLRKTHGLSAAKVKKIRANIRLRRKTDVLGQLDSYMGGT
ncbi:MAG: DNA topoisomerase VI subunit B [Candidatus Hodarchaeales archaeon]|jgi:DNA topoisomerase-6 subunit B